MLQDNVVLDMKVFWKEFEGNFLYKKVFLKVLLKGFPQNSYFLVDLFTKK